MNGFAGGGGDGKGRGGVAPPLSCAFGAEDIEKRIQ